MNTNQTLKKQSKVLIKTQKEIFNISNLLSFSRFIILIPTIYFLTLEENIIIFEMYGLRLSLNRAISLFFMFLLYLSDLADGYFARKYNQITELGKIIDPLADKVCVAVIVLSLVQQGDLPAWYVTVVVARDLLILVAGAYLSSKIKFVLPSNKTGKYTVTLIAVVIVLSMFKAKGLLMDILIHASVFMIFVSIYVYGKRFFEHLNKLNSHRTEK